MAYDDRTCPGGARADRPGHIPIATTGVSKAGDPPDGAVRVSIGAVPIDRITMNETVARIKTFQHQVRENAAKVVTVNAQFIVLARQEQDFADLLTSADLSVADGVPLIWASRLLGTALPERVNGTDLMMRLCKEAAVDGSTLYFLGGRPGAAECAANLMRNELPKLKIVGVDCPPYGFLDDVNEERRVAERIALARPDLLFVGLGAPKQEYWIKQYSHLPVKVMIGIGGSFELIAGFQRRAPLTFQKAGCEWLWRLCMEPRRLWRRYLVGNTIFVYIILRLWLNRCSKGKIADKVMRKGNVPGAII